MTGQLPLANLITLGARDFAALRDFYRRVGWPQVMDDGEFAVFELRGILIAVFPLAMPAFTALDIREIVHQLGQSRTELAAIAIVAALLHVLAAIAAAHVARTGHLHRNHTNATPT